MALTDFLNWLTGADAGAFILVSVAISVFLEDVKWWAELGSKIKYLVIVGVSVLFGIGGVVLTQNPEIVSAIDPFFRPIAYIITAWLATQGIHSAGNVARSIVDISRIEIEDEYIENDFPVG